MHSGKIQLTPFCPWDGHRFGEEEICCHICGSLRLVLEYPGSKDLSDLKNDQGSTKKWRKILYERQPFPDNFTDSTFLIELRRNANIKTYDYWALVYDSAAVTQQISTVTLFAVIFFYTYMMTVSVESFIILQILALLVGYAVRAYSEYILTGIPTRINSMFESVNSMVLLIGVLLALSPVLATLTNSFSNDTIYALTTMLMIIHVVSHDYGYTLGSSNKFQAPVSLNAAIFASVLLGSRLPSTVHVFALIFLAIILFALFPIMRHHLRKKSVDAHLWLTFIMFIVCTATLIPVSNIVAISYIFGTLFITFGSPFWLIWIQKYKNEINGPWDEAIPSSASGYYYSPTE